MGKTGSLKELPSVDEVLKSASGEKWLKAFPRRYVLEAVRRTIDERRRFILEGAPVEVSVEEMAPEIEAAIGRLASFSLRPLINATGIVVHTNLGRSALSEKAVENISRIARGYSNLEYDLEGGRRGKRYAHLKRLLKDATGAEDGVAVNNNAAAVLLVLNTIAKGREVIVSRGELIEIGGSFRLPDVMAAGGALLKEVGTTNKTHLYDYERAIWDGTALLLKVHWSNFRIRGFTSDVPLEELVALGRKNNVPVMYDLGSGSLADMRARGLQSEPSVREVLKSGVDIVTFSGDKLLGGPQAGIIVGGGVFIEMLQKNPLLRALRIDKLTLSALEATLMEYMDEETAKKDIPTLKMLFERPDAIKLRAKKAALLIKKKIKDAEITVVKDSSYAGGGSLPDEAIDTYAVSIRSKKLSVNKLEERLRKGSPAVIGRIREDALLLDMRTVRGGEMKDLVSSVCAALA